MVKSCWATLLFAYNPINRPYKAFQVILRWKASFGLFQATFWPLKAFLGLNMFSWVVGLVFLDASGDDDLCDLLDFAPADRARLAL